MNEVKIYDTDDAIAVLDALHAALTDDLKELEARLKAGQDEDDDEDEVTRQHEARTLLHSGLASIAEVLGWIEWKTEEDPEGEVAAALHPLPTLRGCSIH